MNNPALDFLEIREKAVNAFMAAGRVMLELVKGIQDLVFPPACLICGALARTWETEDREDADFCPECVSGMRPLGDSCCAICGRPFESKEGDDHACADCLRNPPAYDQAFAAGCFEESLRDSVHRFKYNGQVGLAKPLARFMADNLRAPYYPPAVDLILPVPLHPKRLRQRGFNQALVLARELYSSWPEKVRYDILKRIRWTEPQVGLNGKDRPKNVAHAFAVLKKDEVAGKKILIFDDVLTTGATASECARVLKSAGADEVLVLTLTRTV